MADLLQITRGTSATIRETFYLDGAPSDLDGGVGAMPTVTTTKPDGTAGPTSGTVTRISTGLFSFVLAAQAQCTVLTVRWVGTIGGQPQTLTSTVEVIGAELFGLATFRAIRVANGTPFSLTNIPFTTDTQIRDTRAGILDEMTEVLGYSPVPRFARETHNGGADVILHQHHATDLVSVTLAGTSSPIGGYYLHPSGILRPFSNYTASPPIAAGLGNVTVEYVHGMSRVPGNGSHVAMLWAAAQLNPSGFSSATTVSMPDGSTYTYEPSETGRGGFVRHTGIREVDRWLNRHVEIGVA